MSAGHPATASPPPPWQVWSALAAIYVIWGSTYLAIRVMVETMPPALGAGMRFVIAALLILAWLVVRRGPAALRITRRQVFFTAVVGTLLVAGGNGLVTVAERDVPSGLAALLIASMPLWIVLYRTFGGDRPAMATVVGVLVGFCGVAILLLPGGRPDDVPLGMALLVVLAAALWGFGSVVAQRVDLPRDTLVTTGWQMLFGGLFMAIAGLAAGEAGEVDFAAFSSDSIIAFAYLVVVGAIVAYSAYAFLLKHAPISQISTYAYVNPVIAVALGALILDEEIASATVVGTGLIVASVATIVRREARAKSEAEELARTPIAEPRAA